MKKLAVAILALVAANAFAAPFESAQHYLNMPEKYLGKKITLHTAYVMRMKTWELDLPLPRFLASTCNSNGDMAMINVIVPTNKVESFAEKYGSEPASADQNSERITSDSVITNNGVITHPMTGTFRKIGNTYYLEFSR